MFSILVHRKETLTDAGDGEGGGKNDSENNVVLNLFYTILFILYIFVYFAYYILYILNIIYLYDSSLDDRLNYNSNNAVGPRNRVPHGRAHSQAGLDRMDSHLERDSETRANFEAL